MLLLLEQPALLSGADLGSLRGFCQQSSYSTCLNQLNSQVGAFLQHTASPGKTACDAALGPNVPALLQLLSNFLCLQDTRGDACAQVVALALNDMGLLKMATGRAAFDAKSIDGPTTCALLNASGCCGSAFLEVAFAAAQMTCHSAQADAVQSLATQCGGLPAPCGAFNVPAYEAVADCRGVSLPTDCATPPDSCPDSPCELLCAMATNEPPSEPAAISAAAQIAEVANVTHALSPLQAATYLTTCVEIGGGAPLPPRCATTIADLETLVPLSATLPSDNLWGTSDAAILSQLCTEPGGGEMSCMQLLLERTLAWLSAMPQPTTTTCDAVLGPAAPTVAIYATYFSCLSGENGEMCLPQIGGALATAGLGPTLRGNAPLDISAIDPSILCPALGTIGCCAGSFLQVFEGYLAMTCDTVNQLALHNLLQQCDGVPASCANFQLPPVPASDCASGVAGKVPDACAFAAGECPQTPCQLMCAVGALQKGYVA